MHRISQLFGLVCLCSSLGLAACAHRNTGEVPAAAATPPVAAAEPAQDSNAMPASAAADISCAKDGDCHSDQICVADHCALVTSQLEACSSAHVHFSFNSAELEASERSHLQRSARCLQASQSLRLTIEGNADERGTEEFNLALGEKRARAVAKYMETLGTSSSQLKTISYGKDKPLCGEHDETCWSKNRRAAVELGKSP